MQKIEKFESKNLELKKTDEKKIIEHNLKACVSGVMYSDPEPQCTCPNNTTYKQLLSTVAGQPSYGCSRK